MALRRDTMVKMVTGGGKTLTLILAREYRHRVLKINGLTLIVAPIVALIRDQTLKLVSLFQDVDSDGSLPVECLDHMNNERHDEILDRVAQKDPTLRYLVVSPQQMHNAEVSSALGSSLLDTVVRCAPRVWGLEEVGLGWWWLGARRT